MSVVFYRLMFERTAEREPIDTVEDFRAWVDRNLTGINSLCAGYGILDADKRTVSRGDPLWQVLVRPEEQDADFSIFGYMASHQWTIDGYRVHLWIKPAPGENEEYFPIWTRA